MFIGQYNNDFDSSVQNLYDGIVNNDQIFSDNILEAVVRETKNHKDKIEKFSLGLVQLLIQGIKVKVSYYGLNEQNADHVITEWQTKMDTLKVKLETVSNTVKGNYLNQMKLDAQDIILRQHGLGNQGLLDELYDFVTEKYDWRFWFVAVYDEMRGADKHNMWHCGGVSYLHTHDKNVIIASQDKTDSTFNRRNAVSLMNTVQRELVNRDNCPFRGDRAFSLVESMKNNARVGSSCRPYALRLAVSTINRQWFCVPISRRS